MPTECPRARMQNKLPIEIAARRRSSSHILTQPRPHAFRRPLEAPMSARAVAVTQPAPNKMIARLAFLRILYGQRPVARFSATEHCPSERYPVPKSSASIMHSCLSHRPMDSQRETSHAYDGFDDHDCVLLHRCPRSARGLSIRIEGSKVNECHLADRFLSERTCDTMVNDTGLSVINSRSVVLQGAGVLNGSVDGRAAVYCWTCLSSIKTGLSFSVENSFNPFWINQKSKDNLGG